MDRSHTKRQRGWWIFVVGLLVFTAVIHKSKPPAPATRRIENATTPGASDTPNLVTLLADTRADAAKAMLEQHRPSEALAMLVSALKADPDCYVAGDLAREILATTHWSFPEMTLHHPFAVDHLEFAAPSTLWASISGEMNTTVRWNLGSMKIESVLFPIHAPETRSLVFDNGHQFVVIGRAGVSLLCNAKTLRPIRDLGKIPPSLTPSSVITFSPDGLLVAHPVLATDGESPITWQLCDTATGEIVRSSEPSEVNDPRPLAAFMDRTELRVFREDGSIWAMPVSSAEPIEVTDSHEKSTFLQARFSKKGDNALALRDFGPHASPTLQSIAMYDGAGPALTPASFLETDPWTLQPSIWNGLLQRDDGALSIHENTARIASGYALLQAEAPITAAAFSGDRSFIAGSDGNVSIHRSIPPPNISHNPGPPAAPDAATLDALRNLTEALAGETCDETGRTFVKSAADRRLQAFHECDFSTLTRIFPGLDFTPVITTFQLLNPGSATPESLTKLTERLARASSTPADPTALAAIEKTFEENDSAAVLDAIKAAGDKGATAAKALELSLASTHPEWIEACLADATDMPPLLHKLAVSRIEWLQDHKANSLAVWSEGFPDLAQVRLCEDWDGWEQADFGPALASLHLCLAEELATLNVPANSTPEQRKAVFERLADPTTIKAVGRAHFAKACLDAALAFSAFNDEAETTFKLADEARNLGMDAAPCLRAEALSLTTLGNYKEARDRWVTLITECPVETHQPGDYAEAAYTSFENADSRQAMAILNTGMGRFPNDANFALRAGWVALLTGNAEQAYRYLLKGNQIGYPQEKLENATALMAIAAAQSGATDDAAAFYQDLIRLDQDWEKPETIETLDWPEELKESLRQLKW